MMLGVQTSKKKILMCASYIRELRYIINTLIYFHDIETSATIAENLTNLILTCNPLRRP